MGTVCESYSCEPLSLGMGKLHILSRLVGNPLRIRISFVASPIWFLLAGCEGVEPPKLGFGIPAASSAHPRFLFHVCCVAGKVVDSHFDYVWVNFAGCPCDILNFFYGGCFICDCFMTGAVGLPFGEVCKGCLDGCGS